jgi:uncharacterized protein YlxW (UPF0749 family)
MTDYQKMRQLEKDCEYLQQMIKDYELYLSDYIIAKVKRERAAIERDIQLERCD